MGSFPPELPLCVYMEVASKYFFPLVFLVCLSLSPSRLWLYYQRPLSICFVDKTQLWACPLGVGLLPKLAVNGPCPSWFLRSELAWGAGLPWLPGTSASSLSSLPSPPTACKGVWSYLRQSGLAEGRGLAGWPWPGSARERDKQARSKCTQQCDVLVGWGTKGTGRNLGLPGH